MNPYDMTGPEFLGTYLGLLIGVAAAAEVLRWWLRKPGVAVDEGDPELSAYETAYLAGRREGAVHAVVAALARKNVLRVDGRTQRLDVLGELSGGVHPLERTVFEAVRRSPNLALRQLTAAVAEPLDRLHNSLEERGMLVGPDQRVWVRLLPAVMYLGLALFGAGKIAVGLERHKPVEFLVALTIITALVALGRFFSPVHGSRRGDDYLRRARSRNAALKSTLQRHPTGVGGDDMALGVALFGTGILLGGPLDDLAKAVRPPVSPGGGGDGGASCGGGGGCGGGGCGGGGCGGCGG